jgi:hypothetical protein
MHYEASESASRCQSPLHPPVTLGTDFEQFMQVLDWLTFTLAQTLEPERIKTTRLSCICSVHLAAAGRQMEARTVSNVLKSLTGNVFTVFNS